MRIHPALVLLSLASACAAPPPADQLRPKPHPGGVVWRMQQRADEQGRIPRGAVMRAVAQRDAMPLVDGAAPNVQWQWMGPGNIGGRLRGLVIHPTQPEIMWAGTAGGGVWKTVNGGGTWQPMNSVLSMLAIGCMTIDPTDPDRLYIGTGEGGFFDTEPGSTNLATMLGAGVFVSVDGGVTWGQIPSTSSWTGGINRIAIDPNDPSTMLAGTTDGLFRSQDRALSWTKVSNADALDVRYHPTNSNLVVAGTSAGVAMYSTNGGRSWAAATGITNAIRVELCYYRANPNRIYATVNGTNGRIRVYRSDDGGRSYGVRTQGSGVSCLGAYNNGIWVDPTNDQRLLVGATRVHRSLDGGVNLTQITNGGYYDYHTFVEHPGFNGGNNRTVFSGSDGGVHRLDDVAISSTPRWQELNNNLGINQFYGGAVNPSSGVIIGGTQDQGTLRYNGGTESWSKPAGGDGGFVAADQTDPSHFYGEYQWLSLFRSSNGGSSFSSISSGISESSPNFIAPFILDPNNPARMLAAGARLWRTNNVKSGRPSWSAIKPALNCGPTPVSPAHYRADPPCNISSIAVAPGNSSAVWVGHNNGQIWKTQNGLAGSPTWTRVDGVVPDRWVSRIVVDPRDEDRVYVSLMGYQPDSIWLTEDAGGSWRSIAGSGSGALPSSPISGLAVHPRATGVLFAGSDVGMFATLDDGATWQVVPGGAINTSIEELVWKNSRSLLVVTHGRSMFYATLDAPTATPVGSGCGIAGAPKLMVEAPSIGAAQGYIGSGLAANAPATLLVAAGGASATNIGGGCVLRTSLASVVSLPAGSTNSNGVWALSVPLPGDPALISATLTAQLLTSAIGGPVFGAAELTNAVEMTFGY